MGTQTLFALTTLLSQLLHRPAIEASVCVLLLQYNLSSSNWGISLLFHPKAVKNTSVIHTVAPADMFLYCHEHTRCYILSIWTSLPTSLIVSANMTNILLIDVQLKDLKWKWVVGILLEIHKMYEKQVRSWICSFIWICTKNLTGSNPSVVEMSLSFFIILLTNKPTNG